MKMTGTIVKRSDKVAFYGVPSAGGEIIYHRMKGFTELTTSKNASEYSRQYVDEEFETTTTSRYSPSISYAYDEYVGDDVQADIIRITDHETIGSDAIREIVLVNFSDGEEQKGYAAMKRPFAVIPDSEGGSMDAYTYSGTFKSAGEKVSGTAIYDETAETITFTVNAE